MSRQLFTAALLSALTACTTRVIFANPGYRRIPNAAAMTRRSHWFWLLAGLGLGLMLSATARADAPDALLSRHAQLEGSLSQNQFGRPLALDSLDTADRPQGQIYAVVSHPFALVQAELQKPASWCDVMSLHMNTKYCRAVSTSGASKLLVNIGQKTPEELKDVARVEFAYTVDATSARYLKVRLDAASGPMGTRDYRIDFEAVALGGRQTFIHLSYSYAANLSARLAMATYLATLGRGKIGFTQVPRADSGPPDYIGGIRAIMERNTMRYYLAIDSFLDAAATAPSVQLETRLQSWFTATERYPRQLHEMERDVCVAMKREEYLRQHSAD